MDELLALLGWVRIIFVPTLLGGILGCAVSYFMQNRLGLLLCFLLIIAGLSYGLYRAIRLRNKDGQIDFLSGKGSAPEDYNSEERTGEP